MVVGAGGSVHAGGRGYSRYAQVPRGGTAKSPRDRPQQDCPLLFPPYAAPHAERWRRLPSNFNWLKILPGAARRSLCCICVVLYNEFVRCSRDAARRACAPPHACAPRNNRKIQASTWSNTPVRRATISLRRGAARRGINRKIQAASWAAPARRATVPLASAPRAAELTGKYRSDLPGPMTPTSN